MVSASFALPLVLVSMDLLQNLSIMPTEEQRMVKKRSVSSRALAL